MTTEALWHADHVFEHETGRRLQRGAARREHPSVAPASEQVLDELVVGSSIH